MVIEEYVSTEDDWERENSNKAWGEKTKICLKLFHERKEIRKSEAATKANKKAKETWTITCPVEPTKTTEETIQQLHNTVPLIASLKTKAEPASTFSALTNITICIPEQRRSNPKHNGKKNFALDKLVFWSSDSSSESISEEESVAWYCSKCYREWYLSNNGITRLAKMLTLIVTSTESLNAVIANKAVQQWLWTASKIFGFIVYRYYTNWFCIQWIQQGWLCKDILHQQPGI